MHDSPPQTAERLLLWCLRATPSATYIVGDLRQEYVTLLGRRRRLVADLWYWREAMRVGLNYVGRRPDYLGTRGRGPRVSGPAPSSWRALAGDLLGAFRVFRTSPGFVAAVVLALGLGLGANATMFGAVDRVLLSPPEHVRDHQDLRFVHLTGLGARTLNSPMAYSFPDYEAIRNVPVLAGAAAYRPRRRITMGSGLNARRPLVQEATAEFFPLLGVLPAHGRFFDAQDDRSGAPPVAVLGHGFWEQEFGGDPDAIGRTVTFGTQSYEVIGVAPRGFTGANLEAVDMWLPLRMNVPLVSNWDVLSSRGAWWFRIIARLDAGVTDEEVEIRLTEAHQATANAAAEAGDVNAGDSQGAAVRVGSFMMALGPNADSDTAITLWLAGVSILVLLIACANVANLTLARGIARQRERAVRLALGVSRGRLISQALAEALLLAAASGLAAIFVARWTGQALYAFLLPGIPIPDSPIGPRLIGFLSVMVLTTTVLAGVLPALQASRTAPGDVLRRAGRNSTGGRGRVQELLTVGQIGLTTVLLVGAGLFVQSLQNALRVDPGYDQESLIAVEFESRPGTDGAQINALYRDAARMVNAMPGVDRAVLSSSGGPLQGWDEMGALRASRIDSVGWGAQGGPYTYAGTEGWVETSGLRIVRGRGFESTEYAMGAQVPLMVSRSFAEGVWPGLDPLQECVYLRDGTLVEDGPEPCRPIVGVYEDIAHFIGDQGLLSVMWPLPLEGSVLRGLLVRTEGDPHELLEPLRDGLVAMSSDIRYVRATVLADRFESMRGPWRVGATLFSAFGLLALVVASLGLYSMLSFAVARRTRELGIRSALGAQRLNLVAMVVTRAARTVGVGLVVGIAVAVSAGRLLEALLFGVPAVNPLVFGAVAGVLIASALLAAWVPAWKATAVDPMGAIAAE